jgi:ABC-type spermidine/putrescine transport system permease subunit II
MSTTDVFRLRLAGWLAALVAAVLLAGLLARSTETWSAHDPAAARRLLELRAEARDFARRWETAQRGDARFAYDTEIRVLTTRIEEMEARARRPERGIGIAAWERFVAKSPALAASLAATLAETALAVGLAFAAVLTHERRRPGPRLVATALLLAPLALPPALLADRLADLARRLGLGPSPGLAGAAGLLAATALALLLLRATGPRLDPSGRDLAHDLGLTPAETFRRTIAEPWARALGLAAVVVFARLLGDVSIARLATPADPLDHWGGWLRHRLLAAIDLPTAAAGALVAIALGLGLAGLALRLLRRHRGSTRAEARRAPRDRPARLRVTVIAAGLGLVGAVIALPTAPTASTAAAEGVRAAVADWTIAGLAALLAAAVAVAPWRSLDRAPARLRRRVAGLAVLAAALPAPAIGLALRIAGGDLGLAAGSWIAVATGLAVAAPSLLLFLLTLAPLGETAASATHDLDGRATRHRLAALAPAAIALAFALALAAADTVVIFGLADRPRPWASTAGLDLSLPVLAVALAFGLLVAAALDRAEAAVGRRGGLDL